MCKTLPAVKELAKSRGSSHQKVKQLQTTIRYAKLTGHGYKMLAEAMEAALPYEIKCPALLICGEKDHAGSCIRYNKAWHNKTGIPIEWIKGTGHNSNTDRQAAGCNALLLFFCVNIRREGLIKKKN